MIHILHSIGWGIATFVAMFLILFGFAWNSHTDKLEGFNIWMILSLAAASALAMFLLTL